MRKVTRGPRVLVFGVILGGCAVLVVCRNRETQGELLPSRIIPCAIRPALELTDGSVPLRHPTWSPSGERIAAVSFDNNSLWLLSPKEGQARKLVDAEGVGSAFVWCNSDRLLAYRCARWIGPRRRHLLLLLDLETGHKRALADTAAAVSPPSSCVARGILFFQVGDSTQVLHIARRDTTLVVEAVTWDAAEGHGPQCAAVFAVGNVLQRWVAGPALRRHDEFALEGQVLNPAISPDGSKAAYELLGSGGVWVLDFASGEKRYLGEGRSPRWSPRGDYIACVVQKDDGIRITQSDIVLYHWAGGAKIRVTDSADRIETDPDWHPNGDKLVYADELTGKIYQAELVYEPVRDDRQAN